LLVNGGTLGLDGLTLAHGAAGSGGFGGAVLIQSGTVTVTNSTFSGNSAGQTGGAILNTGALSVTNSTFVGNSATGGGAIASQNSVTLSNSTLSGNSAGTGGALYIVGGTLTLSSSILANSPSGGNCFVYVAGGASTTDDGYNLTDGNGSDCGLGTANHDLLNTNPQLGSLANNSGPTQTPALDSTSPAIDQVPTGQAGCPAGGTDQRGVPRPDNGETSCDIGAYESVDQTLTCPTYAQIKTVLTSAPATPVARYLLTCPTGPDTIDFSAAGNGTITPTQSVTLDASGSPYPITFDGGGKTQLLVVNGGSLGLDGLTLAHGRALGLGLGALGGAILIEAGRATATNSTFSDNTAVTGGGILVYPGAALNVSNSTFVGNVNEPGGGGGALYVNSGSRATVTSSTFSGNGAAGGGQIVNGGTLTIADSIMANSTSGGNCAGGGVAPTDGGYNLTDDTSCGFTNGTNNDVVVNAGGAGLTSQLGWNGGPTQTLALLAGSPAIDKIPSSLCLSTDQRGEPRPGDTANGNTYCDMGAFEAHHPLAFTLNASMTYGSALSLNGLSRSDPGSITFSPSITFSGDWNGDTAAQISGTTSGCTTTATSSSSVGTYPITGCTGFGLTGHDVSFAGGTLTIKPADLMIMGANQRITYGSSIPALTWLEKTFVSSTVPVSLATQPTCQTAATSNSPVGSYSITCSGAGSPNYTFHYDQGVLTIAPASLVIAAKNATVVKGQPLPKLKFWANFVHHDSASSLLHRPMCKSPVKLDRSGKISSPAGGTYPITCSGAKGKNYRIRYRNAVLRVVKRMT
jgi:predicted outer membrane repeat protein